MKYCNFSSDAVSIVLPSFGGNTEPQANCQRKQASNSVRNLIHIPGTSTKYPAGESSLATCFLGDVYMEKEKKRLKKEQTTNTFICFFFSFGCGEGSLYPIRKFSFFILKYILLRISVLKEV